ncbi:MAG TPA: transporter substrate-binding domain-containing protein [Cellvibrio sp.]|nr:transporter substrate-binding domain-containing protein [Cellvibrio sp.]
MFEQTFLRATRGLGTTIFALAALILLTIPVAQAETGTAVKSPSISMWNGNKTASRQAYEREILEAVLNATKKSHGRWELKEDKTDYPAAEDEASVFRAKGFDIFGTVAGNQKLAKEQKILVPIPLMKGLLGYRILIIRAEDKAKFATISTAKQLQALRLGIPATWADAELFRQNGYKVEEKGSFDELFARLENKEFDYVSFGANEVAGVFAERAATSGNLVIESSLLVYYPFPLVFYVNPAKPELAARVTQGLQAIAANGELDRIFNRYFGAELKALELPGRTKITLKNPILPVEMADFAPSL